MIHPVTWGVQDGVTRTADVKYIRSGKKSRMHGVSTICTGMSGNGARTGIVCAYKAGMILRGLNLARNACFAAGIGAASRCLVALRIAATMCPTGAARTSASALPWFGNKYPLFFWAKKMNFGMGELQVRLPNGDFENIDGLMTESRKC